MVDGIDKIDILIHQLSQLEGDLDKLDSVRQDLARAEVRAVRTEIVDLLIQALEEGDVSARRGAAYGLSKLPDKEAVSILIRALADEDDSVRSWASEALGEIQDKSSLGHLVKALKEENPYVAYNITRAIMKFPKGEVVEAVSCALDMTDRNTRRRAAKLLGELKYKKSVPRLSALLSDPDPAVRYEAVEALRKIGDIKVLGRLISALGDESTDVRYGAIQALRALGDGRAVEPLVRICLENEDLRSYALEAIKELCGDESQKPVLEALDEIQVLVSQVSHRVLASREKPTRRASS